MLSCQSLCRHRIISSVPVKQEIPQLVEDISAAGVRFVYFSPRNMRRSKPVAEKIGLQTDWNCAISLRDLYGEHEDPHRYISNYADWDVKARMPHGVEAIKIHLLEVGVRYQSWYSYNRHVQIVFFYQNNFRKKLYD